MPRDGWTRKGVSAQKPAWKGAGPALTAPALQKKRPE